MNVEHAIIISYLNESRAWLSPTILPFSCEILFITCTGAVVNTGFKMISTNSTLLVSGLERIQIEEES